MLKYFRSLVASSDILITWTIREVRVRYADTRLGLAWLLIYPAAWVILFTFLFGQLFRFPMAGVPYPLFVMAGLVPWLFFFSTTSNAVSSLRNNSNLIPKVYFPREILIISSVLVGLVDFGLYMLPLGGMMLFYKVGGGLSIVLLIPIIATLAALTLGVSLLASRLALFRRDVQLLVPLALQFLMYCAPIFYPTEMIAVRYRELYLLNPLAGTIDAFRRVLIYGSLPDGPSLAFTAIASFVLLAYAYVDFKRAEPEFADRL